jgi:4-hydroxythreonine-4-phosphate dehydrogenase
MTREPARSARPLAVTMGEPAGIGLEITLMAWRRRRELGLAPLYLIADPGHVAQRARLTGFDVKIAEVDPAGAAAVFDQSLPVVPVGEKVTAAPGRPDAASGPAAIASIRRAVDHVLNGEAAAIVTNPIAKEVVYGAGLTEPGHTEFLAKLSRQATGKTFQPVMLLWSDALAVVPVTIHVPVKDVPKLLTTGLIVETGRIVARELAARFGIARPRLAVTGLNPHAGEGGTIGVEEARVIAPAIAQLAAEGVDVRGPLPADTMFHPAARATYDAALCMYHDQALIPVKMLAFDSAVNVTLGLPFVRTSPDHGTAFDIAGTARANPGSLIAALKLATRLTQRTPAAVSA